MQKLIPSDDPSGIYWQLHLSPGLTSDSPELFSFYTYELRVGHVDMWSTAQGRFGRPLKVEGVQHRAPALTCDVVRTHTVINVSLPYAQPVLFGVAVQRRQPASNLWVKSYAQAEQLDGKDARNVLLATKVAMMSDESKDRRTPGVAYGTASFMAATVQESLLMLGFTTRASLSVLGVELLPQDAPPDDPLGAGLGKQRILRTSPLTPVPPICG